MLFHFSNILNLNCQTENVMQLKSEFIHPNKDAPVMVIFGGNPEMRNHVISMLADFGKVTAYGTLCEEEGIRLLSTLPKVDFILIGGRYDAAQRKRIKKFIAENLPNTFTSEPGIDYPYGDEGVLKDLSEKLNLN